MTRHPQFWPSVALVVAATAWGLYWIPLRAFEEAGLAAAWATLAQFLVPGLLLAPIAVWRLLQRKPTGVGHISTAICLGGAFALYSDSLLLTEVARTMILFYVSPAWSTILEIVVLKRRLTAARCLAVALGLAGLYVILGGDGGVPLPRNLGDWMALVSGMLWAVGTLRVRQSGAVVSDFENVFGYFVYGSLIAGALTFLPIDAFGHRPTAEQALDFLPWLLAMALCAMIPVVFGMLWATRHVDPGRAGILFQMEAVCGIASAALLTTEPFGWIEGIGSVLVISAALIEVLGNRQKAA